jgi:hypothetical protein
MDTNMKTYKIFSPLTGVIFVLFISIIAWGLPCQRNEIINLGVFVATVTLAVIAYSQLKALREQANADFLLTFNREFFGNETYQKIIIAIEEKKNLIKENKGEFTLYQIDDYLGYYELMAHYEKKGFIDFELLDEMFGHYISLAWQNPEIKSYVTELRTETKDQRYYKPFEKLATRVIEIEKKIRK